MVPKLPDLGTSLPSMKHRMADPIPPDAAMHVDVIDTLAALDALKSDWQALEARDPEGTVFLSFRWLRRAFAEHPNRWRVMAVHHQGTLVCIFPMKYRMRWSKSGNMLQSQIEAGGRLIWSEYTGFLCDPRHETQALALLARTLQGMPWSEFSLRYETSQRRARLFTDGFDKARYRLRWPGYLINGGETDNLICPQVTLPDTFEDYMQNCLSSNTRQKLRRFMRRHLDSGEVRITEADPSDFRICLRHMMRLWVAKWAPSKGERSARKVSANFAQVMIAAQEQGLLYMPVLWRGDQPLGVLGHVLDPRHRRMHFVIAGRDEGADAPYIGHLLHAHAIRWGIDNAYTLYDFCHGNEAYKYSFGATDRRVNYFTIWRRSGAGREMLFDPISAGEALEWSADFLNSGDTSRARRICAQLAEALP